MDQIITSVMMPWRYCVGVKADILNVAITQMRNKPASIRGIIG